MLLARAAAHRGDQRVDDLAQHGHDAHAPQRPQHAHQAQQVGHAELVVGARLVEAEGDPAGDHDDCVDQVPARGEVAVLARAEAEAEHLEQHLHREDEVAQQLRGLEQLLLAAPLERGLRRENGGVVQDGEQHSRAEGPALAGVEAQPPHGVGGRLGACVLPRGGRTALRPQPAVSAQLARPTACRALRHVRCLPERAPLVHDVLERVVPRLGRGAPLRRAVLLDPRRKRRCLCRLLLLLLPRTVRGARQDVASVLHPGGGTGRDRPGGRDAPRLHQCHRRRHVKGAGGRRLVLVLAWRCQQLGTQHARAALVDRLQLGLRCLSVVLDAPPMAAPPPPSGTITNAAGAIGWLAAPSASPPAAVLVVHASRSEAGTCRR